MKIVKRLALTVLAICLALMPISAISLADVYDNHAISGWAFNSGKAHLGSMNTTYSYETTYVQSLYSTYVQSGANA